MQCILDRSHFSGTDLDRDIVAFAEAVYMYRLQEDIAMDDSEGWQWAADDALEWMNEIEYENEKVLFIDDNSLYIDDMTERDESWRF